MQEIIFWLYNRQLLKELTMAINILSHLRNVEWIQLSTEVCLTASLLINEYKISPFDAYHAATAMSRDKTILSTEHVYDKIKGLIRKEPTDFIKDL
jgi:predicted nucleic acid-binding protein